MPGKGDGNDNKADERESTEEMVDGHDQKGTTWSPHHLFMRRA
jgi:hypothetical protein